MLLCSLIAGGFKLEPGETESVTFSDEWVGRVWARTGCGVGPCETGDCGGGKLHCDGAGGVPPVTLLEVAFDGYMELDYYDISLVDGFNVEVSMTPKPGTYQPWSGSIYYCNTTSCLTDINHICPDESMKVFDENGTVIAWKSACLAFNTDRYCCRGKWGSACHCPPFKYSEIFKKACPDAYSYAYDDKKSTFTCKSKPGTKTGYTISFC